MESFETPFSESQRRLMADKDFTLKVKPPKMERNPFLEARIERVLEMVGVESRGFVMAMQGVIGRIDNSYVRSYLEAMDDRDLDAKQEVFLGGGDESPPVGVVMADRYTKLNWCYPGTGAIGRWMVDAVGLYRSIREEEIEREAARVKSLDFLASHLTIEQREEILLTGSMTVEAPSGNRYLIEASTGAVSGLGAGGKVVSRYCYHPSWKDQVPGADVALAMKLMLETEEEEFLANANRTPADGSDETKAMFRIVQWFRSLSGQESKDALPAYAAAIKDYIQVQVRQAMAFREMAFGEVA
jgi:hypothetical protein